MTDSTTAPLAGKVALVAGATRGAGRGIAVALGAAGATVYGTGRTTRTARSEYDRPETIEDTAELVDAAAGESDSGGRGIAVQVDHLEPAQVEALVARIDDEHGRLDILVNDIWGAENLTQWNTPIWEHDLDKGLRTLRLAVETHLITSHFALGLLSRRPGGLVVEVTDGTYDYNLANYRLTTFYDLAKWSAIRLAYAFGEELAPVGSTAVVLTPGWLRSEMMLEHYGVTEETWREALDRPFDGKGFHPGHFGISETPAYSGRAVAALAADADVARWNKQSLSSGQLAREYGFTDVDGSQPDAWRYLVEVQDAGLPPNPGAYR
jgi:NAD(P)-dependent dehydrogenase (short-subunit alcohol dehydrogenase family)